MFVYVETPTVGSGVISTIVCPLSATISSFPEDRALITKEDVVWKSGCEVNDWIMNFVIQFANLIELYFAILLSFYLVITNYYKQFLQF